MLGAHSTQKKSRSQGAPFHIKTLVPRAGIEPARLAAGDFESPASTNFTTWAALIMAQNVVADK